MKKFDTLIFSLLICSFQLSSQISKFTYSTETCIITASYDVKKYTKKQLEQTNVLVNQSSYVNTDATSFDIEHVESIKLEHLTYECDTLLRFYKNLNIVNTPYFKELREKRIREIKETCELRAITIQAWKDPTILMSYTNVDSKAKYYREALIKGGDALLKAWRKLVNEQKIKNGFPQSIEKEYQAQYASNNRLRYAQLKVMTFGWWNACNHLIYHYENDGSVEAFQKLFIEILTEDCDEP